MYISLDGLQTVPAEQYERQWDINTVYIYNTVPYSKPMCVYIQPRVL